MQTHCMYCGCGLRAPSCMRCCTSTSIQPSATRHSLCEGVAMCKCMVCPRVHTVSHATRVFRVADCNITKWCCCELGWWSHSTSCTPFLCILQYHQVVLLRAWLVEPQHVLHSILVHAAKSFALKMVCQPVHVPDCQPLSSTFTFTELSLPPPSPALTRSALFSIGRS
jgi:hypothetical protein